MSSFNLVQIVPSLDSGGVERGTVDVANFLAEKKNSEFYYHFWWKNDQRT